MSEQWSKTSHTGIYRSTQGRLKVRTTATDPTGRIREKQRTLPEGADLTDAVQVRRQMQAEIRCDDAPTVSERSITHFAAQWVARRIDSGRWRKRTAADRRQYLRDHILPHIGHLEVDELSREHIRDWIEYADSVRRTHSHGGKPLDEPIPYGHSTVRSWWSLVRGLIKALYLEGHADFRLVEWCRDQVGPQGYRSGRREDRTLTYEQLVEYVETAKRVLNPQRFAEVLVLSRTGMRAGELYGLDWSHVDEEQKAITVEQSFSGGRLGPTKTSQTRVVPVDGRVLDALEKHRKRLVRLENIGLFEGILFPATNGRRRRSESLHKPMKKVGEAVGLDVKVGPQVLRSSVVTILKEKGAHKEQIKALVGHESDEMHDHYTRPTTEEIRQIAGLLGS